MLENFKILSPIYYATLIHLHLYICIETRDTKRNRRFCIKQESRCEDNGLGNVLFRVNGNAIGH